MCLIEDLSKQILAKIFNVDIMSFLTQNLNPINLNIKLDSEKECDMVKFLWDECIPHKHVQMVNTNFFPAKNFNLISNPNLTYQKANEMALKYFFDDLNRINTAKFKIE